MFWLRTSGLWVRSLSRNMFPVTIRLKTFWQGYSWFSADHSCLKVGSFKTSANPKTYIWPTVCHFDDVNHLNLYRLLDVISGTNCDMLQDSIADNLLQNLWSDLKTDGIFLHFYSKQILNAMWNQTARVMINMPGMYVIILFLNSTWNFIFIFMLFIFLFF